MFEKFFDGITRLSLRFRWVTLALGLIVLVAGVIAASQLNLELLPRVEFPQTVVVAQWGEAESSRAFLEEVTVPLEEQLSEIEGVVNVESTTSGSFAFIIVRNDFGIDQERVLADVEEAVANTDLPADMDTPQVLNFSLSDLPVVVASISSPDLSLEELKAVVNENLQPQLAGQSGVSEVTVSGGQVLPDEAVAEGNGEETEAAEVETAAVEEPTATPAPTAAPTATPDPAALPEVMVQGAAASGFELETARDITPELMRQLALFPGAAQFLAMLTPDNLRAMPAESIALLPADFVETLDDDLRADLDELSADYGGTGALALAEAEAEEEEGAGAEELPEVEPAPLPESWVAAGQQAGATLETTADLTPEVMEGIVSFAPQLIDELEPEMWRALEPPALAVALGAAGDSLDPLLLAELQAILAAAGETDVEPVPLPESWVAGAEQMGLAVETTADLTPEIVAGIGGAAPEMLQELTPEMVLALSPEAQAALPEAYVSELDEGLQEALGVIAIRNARFQAEQSAEQETVTEATAEVEPVTLPESWVAAGQQAGATLETTADLTPEVMEGIVSFAPQLLDELEPEMWRALEPPALAVALGAAEDSLEPLLLAELQAILAAAGETDVEPVPLPESWIAGAEQMGLAVETTADLTPEIVAGIGGAAPEMLQELAPEMVLALSPEAQAALPEAYVSELDEGVQETIAIIALRAQQQLAEADEQGAGQAEATPAPTPEPTRDPARLPDMLVQGASSFGLELETAADITPDLMRQLASIPQAAQFLELLSDDNLRALPPESIALLPPDFVDNLDAELRADLDELAAEYGGAGALAAAEAAEQEEAEASAGEAPALPEPWSVPDADGNVLFADASDILFNDFGVSGAELINLLPTSPNIENPAAWMGSLSPEVMAYLAENEEGFVEGLNPGVLELMSPDTLTFLLDEYPDAFEPELAQRLQEIAAGDVEVFVPESSVTRTDGDPAVIINVFKAGDANTVAVADGIFETLDAFSEEQAAAGQDVNTALVFEQATFIEDSIEGVSREGILGAVFAIIIILIFLSGRVNGRYILSWRSTAVTAVSIPLSVFAAFLLMRWVPPTVGSWMEELVRSTDSTLLTFVARLFPESVTLNIMTLSGLTVAVGRVVDDSIVVLENIYRYIQTGNDPKDAVLAGTREVAIAIFASTATTIAVFLPLGLIGGLIGSFFLPFGLTVTYALAASFVIAITIVPTLAYILIRKEYLPDEEETVLQRWYTPILEWALANRFLTMLLAFLLFAGSLFLLNRLPQSFIPAIGEPTINVGIELEPGTPMAETDEAVARFEEELARLESIETVQTEIGSGGGFESFFGGGGVQQNVASLTISVTDQDALSGLTNEVRDLAEAQFGEDDVVVSAAAQTGFGGFSLTVTGESLEQLETIAGDVRTALGEVDLDEDGRPDITNVSSSLEAATAGSGETIIRIDGQPAINFSGELETENTLGVTNAAKERVQSLDGLPQNVEVTEGFESEQQVEGFQNMVVAIGYSIIVVYLIMALTFRSLIHPFTILFSLPFALVGAAVALFVTNSVLGISAMIGLMMLVGIVVTNAIVLMELVQQLRARGRNAYEALVEAGRTRLRPIWMTALTAVLALIPLAASQESGAVIASELARAVIGGLLVSTALTLIVVPVVYSLFEDLIKRFRSS